MGCGPHFWAGATVPSIRNGGFFILFYFYYVGKELIVVFEKWLIDKLFGLEFIILLAIN